MSWKWCMLKKMLILLGSPTMSHLSCNHVWKQPGSQIHLFVFAGSRMFGLEHVIRSLLNELTSAKSSLVHFFAPAVVLVVLMEPKEMADKTSLSWQFEMAEDYSNDSWTFNGIQTKRMSTVQCILYWSYARYGVFDVTLPICIAVA